MKTKNDLAQARLAREWRTMTAMVEIFCRNHQPAAGLCAECREFLAYANVRLERCHFGAEKPVCAKCPVHCYQRERREQVRTIMRHAGPRMLWRHPVLSASLARRFSESADGLKLNARGSLSPTARRARRAVSAS